MKRRILGGMFAAFAIVGASVALLHAMEGPYNSNPPYCRSSSPWDPLWWYFECQYPDPPDWGVER